MQHPDCIFAKFLLKFYDFKQRFIEILESGNKFKQRLYHDSDEP